MRCLNAPPSILRARQAIGAIAFSVFALLFLGCAGGGTSTGSTGGLTLQALWERSSQGQSADSRFRRPAFEGTSEIPPSVSLVEVRVDGAGRPRVRCFVDPRQSRTVTIDRLQTGRADVTVFGYDIEAPARNHSADL